MNKTNNTQNIGPAWTESNRLSRTSQMEENLQAAVTRRATNIAGFMADGYSREEAEQLAGRSTFGPRLVAMTDELIDHLTGGNR